MLRRITSGLVALIAVAVFATTLAHALLFSPSNEVTVDRTDTPSQPARQPQSEGRPMRLVIPSLSVDADVQDVGITSHNTMAVPTNFTDVGWYRYGPEPGENGSAVMAGHVDNALALPGVFKHLQDIEIGADVYVHTQNGSELHFVVDDVQTYKASDAPSDEIFDPDTEPRLNLITCEGTWIQSERQYDHRLVVYTHLVS